MNKFQAAQQKIIDASAAAAEQAKNNLQSAYENASKIDMNIKLKAPVIIIPTNSTSYDAIMIDLGNIELTNNFLKLDIENIYGKVAVVDDLNLELLNMKISRVLLNKHLDKLHESIILKPLTLTLNIKRNLSTAWYNMIPNIDVAGKVKSIHVREAEGSIFIVCILSTIFLPSYFSLILVTQIMQKSCKYSRIILTRKKSFL